MNLSLALISILCTSVAAQTCPLKPVTLSPFPGRAVQACACSSVTDCHWVWVLKDDAPAQANTQQLGSVLASGGIPTYNEQRAADDAHQQAQASVRATEAEVQRLRTENALLRQTLGKTDPEALKKLEAEDEKRRKQEKKRAVIHGIFGGK